MLYKTVQVYTLLRAGGLCEEGILTVVHLIAHDNAHRLTMTTKKAVWPHDSSISV